MLENLKLDTAEFEKQLRETQLKFPTIARKALNRVSGAIRKEVRSNIKGDKSTGRLYNSIRYKSERDFTGKIFASAFYASTLENGAVINAKGDNYLTFQIDGEWKKVKQVTIPARPFLLPVIQNYFNSSKAMDLMNEVLQEELSKMENKQ